MKPAAWTAGTLAVAGFLVIFLLRYAGAGPGEAFRVIVTGAAGSWKSLADVVVCWIPLALASAGVLVAYRAGLWNIGAEGQIVAGAVLATWILRGSLDAAWPAGLALVLALLAGGAGGAGWAAMSIILKIKAGVHEIFGGLGLNFIASALVVWLVFGPWKRPGTASMSGTAPFPPEYVLDEVPGCRLSLYALAVALAALALVCLLLNRSRLGLRWRAAGGSLPAARRFGLPVAGLLMSSTVTAGALAGLAGALQLTAVYHRLIPAISSGYGYLGLLAVLMSSGRFAGALAAAGLFSVLNIGGIHLPLELGVDSTLSGVLQGMAAFSFLVAGACFQHWKVRKEGE